MRLHFSREIIECGEVQVLKVSSEDNVVDMMHEVEVCSHADVEVLHIIVESCSNMQYSEYAIVGNM